uniref:Uncharacterized protein n=1 Tax=Cryptomonas curvata TaxID=233186 RepID=A0A7S0MAE5_9CRYP|mmetsp:Transcript_31889/g.66687  ORF Transcript_31889/g.66687 Transcript_31889/m.66687 type:complete len:115 (-) Transcript_31889:45-389(-)
MAIQMSSETSVEAPAQYPIPTRFICKNTRTSRLISHSTEFESKSARPEADKTACENESQESSKICLRPRCSTSRAQYNRFIGEMNREEAKASFKSEMSKDLARFEELFLQLSED